MRRFTTSPVVEEKTYFTAVKIKDTTISGYL